MSVETTARQRHTATAVLHVGGMYRGSENAVVEAVLRRVPGLLDVEGNAAAQTATVTYDPSVTSVAELRNWIEECGYHCAGRSVPDHICDPLMEEGAPAAPADEAHAHGGHAGMSMDDMERDMRNRFLVALVFTIPTVVWSPVGETLFGSMPAVPLGLDMELWQFLLSLPIVLYASSIFFTGALAALRARTLDMMVLVAVAIGVGWIYSVAATFFIEGEVFYEAAAMLASFVLLGHWFEMRARGGANDAIRALLDLAPPMATVIRGGEPVDVPTADVRVGTCCWSGPAPRSPSTQRSSRASPRSTNQPSPGRACRSTRLPATSWSARPSTRTARCALAPPRSDRKRHWRRSSSSSKRRRTPRLPANGSPTGPRSGSCWSRSSAGA